MEQLLNNLFLMEVAMISYGLMVNKRNFPEPKPSSIENLCDDPQIIEEYKAHCRLVDNMPNFSTTTRMSPEDFLEQTQKTNNMQDIEGVKENISDIRKKYNPGIIDKIKAYFK